MAKAWYCSRGDVKSALSIKETARMNKQIDKAINSASDIVEGMLHRKFYPEIATHYFAGGDFMVTSAGELYLYGYDVLEVTGLIVNGVTVSSDDYFIDTGDAMDADDFPGALTTINPNDELIISGTFGYTDRDVYETDLVGSVNDSALYIELDRSDAIDVGHTIRIDSERMRVQEKLQKSSGQTTTTELDSKANSVLVGVADSTGFNVGEVILVDAEKMLIVDIAGNNLIVERSYDGSVLASHVTASVVYVPRKYKVTRGALGTTAASHVNGADVFRLTPPGLIQSLCIAEALNILGQQKSGYAKTVGTRDSLREVGGIGLPDIRQAAKANYRKFRSGAA